MKYFYTFILTTLIATGCSSVGIPIDNNKSNYGYHPLDPLPVNIVATSGKPPTNQELLESLPDETMRIAIGELDSKGSLTYGPATVGVAGNSYIVILDYMKFNTNALPVIVTSNDFGQKSASLTKDRNQANVIVPTYIGIGLRMTANIKVNKGKINLGSLFALGAAAESKQISGSMVIQTLGISGESISSIMPMPSEISSTTIQNAILALGTMKAKMYDDDTHITPRVIGVYNNLGGGSETINGFISTMLQKEQDLKVNQTSNN
ncbi:hypothetical protein [Vibrio splendidus]|uniref:hypothetical protein n=1 Tax=Vibrio splendidus TaxID=29497 RepID=UPI000769FCFB|nr:hypothetical protein [Vibrio splendidus]PHX05153.1 hypothetical protein VSPL_34830 [Vibrio splendidus]PMG27257.1 hypothetical protein BCU95_06395 [Vibrio splendidus]